MEYRLTRGLPADYGVLGLLLDGAAHGYDLQERARDGLGSLWRIAQSQLYSVLHELEQRGWVQATERASPSGPRRTTYALTPAGRQAFFAWALGPVARPRDVRVEFLAKLFFLRRHRPDELDSLLRRQADALRRAAASEGATAGDPWIADVAASFRRRQTESVLAWVDEVRRELQDEGKDRRQ